LKLERPPDLICGPKSLNVRVTLSAIQYQEDRREISLRTVQTTLISISLMMLIACAKPLPVGKTTYAGEWQGGPITLVITADGRAVYKRKEGGMSKSINAPIKEFKGDNFVVGVGFLSTEFVVSKPPHEEAGAWKMTIDGVELTRLPDGTIPNEDSGST
jgi:hypothetical protein